MDPQNVTLTKCTVRKAIWIGVQIRHSQKIDYPLSQISLHYRTVIDQRLSLSTTIQLEFSWTLQMSDPQNDRFTKPSDSPSISLSTMCPSWELFQRIFFQKWINFWIRHSKKFPGLFSNISLHYQTVIDQRLTVLQQLYCWTSVGPLKGPIYKMISSQGHLTVWAFPWVPCVLAKNCFSENFFEMNKLSN